MGAQRISQLVTQVGKVIGAAVGEDSDLHTEGAIPSTPMSMMAVDSGDGESG